uniref:Telomere repeat-binding protein 5-like isoform X3 n=1 Tax=Rhizophora mucronata TaxID=61149 RepID=A0A2P2NGN4_RHIMU
MWLFPRKGALALLCELTSAGFSLQTTGSSELHIMASESFRTLMDPLGSPFISFLVWSLSLQSLYSK